MMSIRKTAVLQQYKKRSSASLSSLERNNNNRIIVTDMKISSEAIKKSVDLEHFIEVF